MTRAAKLRALCEAWDARANHVRPSERYEIALCAAKLRAILDEGEGDGWRPIASAPMTRVEVEDALVELVAHLRRSSYAAGLATDSEQWLGYSMGANRAANEIDKLLPIILAALREPLHQMQPATDLATDDNRREPEPDDAAGWTEGQPPHPDRQEWYAVRTTETWRWLPYKPDGARQMRAKGRWQKHEGYGFENAQWPDSAEWRSVPPPGAAR